MAELRALEDALLKAHQAGDEPRARVLADEVRRMQFGELVRLNREQFDKPIIESRAGRIAASVARGLGDPGMELGKLALRGAETVVPAAAGMRRGLEATQVQQNREYKTLTGYGREGTDWGRMGGNIAATLPLAAVTAPASLPGAVGAGMLTGGISGLLAPTETTDDSDFWRTKAEQAGLGAVGGAGGTLAARGIARVVSGATRPAVKIMRDLGVSPTVGQIVGSPLKRLEEGISRIPVLGEVVRRAEQRGVEQFNKGIINKALENIGEKLDDATPVGHQAIQEAAGKVSSAYQALLPKLSATIDKKFAGDLAALATEAKKLAPTQAKQFQDILAVDLARRFSGPTISGEAMKVADSEIGRQAASYGRSAVANERELGKLLGKTADRLRQLVIRSNPAEAPQLQKIDRAFAEMVRISDAASKVGAKEGVFSPAALATSVRVADKSLRKGSVAKGTALLQREAEAGKSVLGAQLPDSGTPFGLLASQSLLYGLPPAAYWLDPRAGAVAALLTAPYTKLGQRGMAAALASRPESMRVAGEMLRRLAPAAAPALAPLPQALLGQR